MMIKKISAFSSVIIACTSLVLVACNHSTQKSPEAKQAAPVSQGLNLYSGQPNQNVRIVIESPTGQQELTGNKADVAKVAGSSAPNAEVTVFKSLKSTAGDALTFSWKDSWRASLNFEVTSPVNLTDYLASGIVEFD